MIVKYKNCGVPAFGDDFFNEFVSNRYYGNGFGNNPAVNIMEEENEFTIELAAAGLSKKDFKIRVEDDVLSISTEKNEHKKNKEHNYARREFYYGSFNQSFKIGESVNQQEITAEYSDGILTVHLPKKEETLKQEPKKIEIK